MNARAPLLAVRGLQKHFPIRRGALGRVAGQVRAVDGIDLDVFPGETLGVVGESGSGKSTLGHALLRLIEPSGGTVSYAGQDLLAASAADMRRLRRDLQIIFQDPAGSLDPRMTVRQIIAEGLVIHGIGDREEKVNRILDRVGLPRGAADRYPRQFSGGQRQRIGIARALVLEPKLVVADEPVSALDVSIQSQIINLLVELRRQLVLTYVFIAHDIAVVSYIADRIAVMYLGKLVELGPTDTLTRQPRHPYTIALIAAAPSVRSQRRVMSFVLQGDLPSAIDIPTGCRFRTRCPLAQDLCAEAEPALRALDDGHSVACHFPAEAGQLAAHGIAAGTH